MTPRSIRRAAERKATKKARKAAQNAAAQNIIAAEPEFAFQETAEETIRAAKAIEAFDTPATETPSPAPPAAPVIVPAEKANVNLSPVASSLTGQLTLLPTTDAAPYDQFLLGFQSEYQPVGLVESNLVQTLAESAWRARRCLALEMAIFAKGRIEFAPQFAEHKPELRESLIDCHTFLTYEKQIRSLQLQEARLTRRADKATAELRNLQKERRQKEAEQPREPQHRVQQNGFVFSNREIDSYLAQKPARNQQIAATLTSQTRTEAA